MFTHTLFIHKYSSPLCLCRLVVGPGVKFLHPSLSLSHFSGVVYIYVQCKVYMVTWLKKSLKSVYSLYKVQTVQENLHAFCMLIAYTLLSYLIHNT